MVYRSLMRKALATFASGPAVDLLKISLPTFRNYAERHGYDVIVGDEPCERPASWCKVPLLQRLLTTHEFVLWIDADAIIVDPAVDIESVVPTSAFQAFATYSGEPHAGPAPNLGVWALRTGSRTQEFLAAIWRQEDLIDHPFWEQAALMRLMGWLIESPFVKQRESEWDDGTFYLEQEWNWIPEQDYAATRIRHRAGWPHSLRKLDMRTDAAKLNGQLPRYWLGQFERRVLRPRGIRVYDRQLSRTPQALRRRLRRGPAD